MASHSTGAQMEKLARTFGQARRNADAQEQYAAAYLKFTVADDGTVTGSFRLPPAEGAELMQALKAGAGRLPDYESEGEHDDKPERRAAQRSVRAWLCLGADGDGPALPRQPDRGRE